MIRIVLLTICLGFSTSAFANEFYSFSCTTTQNLDAKRPVTIKFDIRVTPSGLFRWAGEPDNVFSVLPQKSSMKFLNDNGGIKQDKEKVTFNGDGDGFVLVYLVLYKNTNYHSGYAQVKDIGGGGGNHYSPVSCKVNKLD